MPMTIYVSTESSKERKAVLARLIELGYRDGYDGSVDLERVAKRRSFSKNKTVWFHVLHKQFGTIPNNIHNPDGGYGSNVPVAKFMSECERYKQIKYKSPQGHPCVVTPDYTFIGCQTFHSEAILQIAQHIKTIKESK